VVSYNVTLVSTGFIPVSQKLVLVSMECYVAWLKATDSVP